MAYYCKQCPHASGGVPKRYLFLYRGQSMSPRKWGCTDQRGKRIREANNVPTQVGVYRTRSSNSSKRKYCPHASDNAKVYINDSRVFGNKWLDFYGNASLYMQNYTGSGLIGIHGYDNLTASIWNSTLSYLQLYKNSTALLSTHSKVAELKVYDSTSVQVRVNTNITILEARQQTKIYLYQSEGCIITTQNLYDSAQVITL